MAFLDIRTILVLTALSSLINAAVMIFIYRIAPRYPGLNYWVLGNTSFAIGCVLVLARGQISDLVSIIIANGFILLGPALLQDGIHHFLAAPAPKRRNWVYPFISLNLLFLSHFTFVHDNLSARVAIAALTIFVVFSDNVWCLMRRTPPTLRLAAQFTTVAFATTALTSLVRGVDAALIPLTDFFTLRGPQFIGFMGALTGNTLCTAGLAGLVVQRLLSDLKTSQQATQTSAQIAEQRVAALEAMSSTLAEILIERSQPHLLQSIVTRAATLLKVESAELLIYDAGHEELTLAAYYPPDPAHAPRAQRPVEGAAGYVARHRQSLLLNDYRAWSGALDATVTNGITAVLAVPLLHGEHLVGVLGVMNRANVRPFTNDDVWLLRLFAQQATVAILNAQLYATLVTDLLTGLNNRRHFFTLGQALLLQSQRDRQPLAVALLDVDHFKKVNDTYGHAIGDQVLTWIAAQCREHLPAEALLGRIGGEEFAVLLPGNTSALAWVQVEGLRQRIATTGVPTSLHDIHVTISAGVTECIPDLPQTLDQLLEHADRMLYQAKHEGRNRVCADSLDPGPTPTTVVPTQAAVGPSCTHLRRPARSKRKLRRLFRHTPDVR